jgi:rhodanese-related sulfurtransferase
VADFLLSNIALIALFVGSGLVLAWPEISRLIGASNEIGTLDATRLLNQATTLVLDVRDAPEFAAGHLPRARNIPLKELPGRLDEIRKYKERPVVVTCRTGPRAGAACRMLRKAGFTAAYPLKGGVAAWQQASLPLEK